MGTFLLTISSLSLGVKKQSYKPSIQPKNEAFSIWSIIFLTSSISGIVLAFSKESQIIASIFCFCSLLLCSFWLIVANTKYAVYVLLSSCACACTSSILFKHVNDLENSLILIGPNFLCSWLTIAGALSFIIHLNQYLNIKEKKWMILPFVFINIGISITNTLLGSYIGSIYITIPVLWTTLFSYYENIWIFLSTCCIQVGFLSGYALSC